MSFFGTCGDRIVFKMRQLLFHSLMKQKIEFYSKRGNAPGQLTYLLSGDTIKLKGLLGGNMAMWVQSISTIVAAMSLALYTNKKLAAVGLIIFSLNMFVGSVQVRVLRGNSYDIVKSTEESSAFLSEFVSMFRTVAAFNLEEEMSQRYNRIVNKSFWKTSKRCIWFGILYGMATAIRNTTYAMGLWYGSRLAAKGEITITGIFQIVIVFNIAAESIGQMTIWLTDVTDARIVASKAFAIVDSCNDEDESLDDEASNCLYETANTIDLVEATTSTTTFGEVLIQNLKFSYPLSDGNRKVLDDVSFSVSAGETVALVGASGCGKSTVLQLLQRFYDNYDGTIKIGKVDIRQFDAKRLRGMTAIVNQEPLLFNTSIRENIMFGLPPEETWSLDHVEERLEKAVLEASKIANAHEFILNQPQGYDFHVGKFGKNLSGGQKQRICIARALIRHPKLLLMDEATSALDTESEQLVQSALNAMLLKSYDEYGEDIKKGDEKLTAIIVAHRLSTIKDADKIVVFENKYGTGATIAEVGTHNSLMSKKNGVYRNFVLQTLANE